jgi:hypothetical protein
MELITNLSDLPTLPAEAASVQVLQIWVITGGES